LNGLGTVAVAGLGLIGGSAARDLAAAGVRVLGWDRDSASVAAARNEGVISAALGSAFEGLEEADVFLIAVPVGGATAVLEAALPRLARARLVTDAGSTKASIVAAAERLGIGERFVGSHPFAGDHRAGWAASRGGLFGAARVYLCPTTETSPAAMAAANALWTALGAAPVEIGADEHDRRLAWTSHLPQVVSSALAAVLQAHGFGRDDLGPGGRDMTRLAGSSPVLWADILRDNRANVVDALAAFEAQVAAARRTIAEGDADVVTLSDFTRVSKEGSAQK
jgi:prephenate dehydrogenase